MERISWPAAHVTEVSDLWVNLRFLFLCKQLLIHTMFNKHWPYFSSHLQKLVMINCFPVDRASIPSPLQSIFKKGWQRNFTTRKKAGDGTYSQDILLCFLMAKKSTFFCIVSLMTTMFMFCFSFFLVLFSFFSKVSFFWKYRCKRRDRGFKSIYWN